MTDAMPLLARLLVLTDRTQAVRPLGDVVRAAVDGGARAVVLREKDLPRYERTRLADDFETLLAPVDGVLIVASDHTIPAVGVHLASSEPMCDHPFVGRSCHQPADLRAAAAEGCAYATVSPVFATESKPGYGPALGTRALRNAPLPVYALGGIAPANAATCIAAGAAGIAAMGTVMRAEHPDRVVSALLRAIEQVAA